MLPVNAVLIAGFYLTSIVVQTNPNATIARVAAFVPPFSPMVVPARMVLGDMNAFGLAIAVALEALATAGLILLAARIYKRSILQTGARVKLAHDSQRAHTWRARRPPTAVSTSAEAAAAARSTSGSCSSNVVICSARRLPTAVPTSAKAAAARSTSGSCSSSVASWRARRPPTAAQFDQTIPMWWTGQLKRYRP